MKIVVVDAGDCVVGETYVDECSGVLMGWILSVVFVLR